MTVPIAEQAEHVFAFDPDSEAIAEARDTLPEELGERVAYAVASAVDVELPRGEFDLVLFSWSL